MARPSNGKSFFLGAFLGGVVGGVSALLFAPKTGKKMRQELACKYEDVSEKASDLLCEVCDQTQELVKKAQDIAADAKEAVSSLKDSLKR